MKPEIVVSICAVFISVLSLVLSAYYGWCTRDHNRRSVKPLPYVSPSDFENLISVRLWNYGNGPLILKDVIARGNQDGVSGHLVDLLPELPDGLYFNSYVKILRGRAIPPGGRLTLVEFSPDVNDIKAIAYREKLRDALGRLSVDVDFTDIYDTAFLTYNRDLTWFHRTKHANRAMLPRKHG